MHGGNDATGNKLVAFVLLEMQDIKPWAVGTVSIALPRSVIDDIADLCLN